jgi:hypothetical protein
MKRYRCGASFGRESNTSASDESARTWNPIEQVIRLFREEFEVASADKESESCTGCGRRTMKPTGCSLKGGLERLADKTGLLNEREKALAFVRVLPVELQKLMPVLYASSKGVAKNFGGGFEIVEKIDLATAYAEGLKGW